VHNKLFRAPIDAKSSSVGEHSDIFFPTLLFNTCDLWPRAQDHLIKGKRNLYFEKYYDKLEWKFMIECLRAMDFGEGFIR